MSGFIIALDGAAASGKGTLGQKLAVHYALSYLDTGLTYRAVAHSLLENNLPLDDEELLVAIAEKVDLTQLDKDRLSSHALGQAASKIAIYPALRQVLIKKQRSFAKHSQGIVLDGRDIGTVVCPNAHAKLFIIADLDTRAQRRFAQIQQKGLASETYEEIKQQLAQRDERDCKRKEGALKPARDALLLDTTKLGIEEAFYTACQLIAPSWQKYQASITTN